MRSKGDGGAESRKRDRGETQLGILEGKRRKADDAKARYLARKAARESAGGAS